MKVMKVVRVMRVIGGGYVCDVGPKASLETPVKGEEVSE